MADNESIPWAPPPSKKLDNVFLRRLAQGQSSEKSSLAINLISLHVKAYGLLKRFLSIGFPKKRLTKNINATTLH